jgi:hypothetical protein
MYRAYGVFQVDANQLADAMASGVYNCAPMQQLEFDFLKDRYDFELSRKEQLTDALNLPIGVLGGMGGLLALLARTFTYDDPVLTWIFVASLAVAIIAFGFCLVQLSRVYHKQAYAYLPLLETLEHASKEFRDYGKAMAGGEAEAMEAFAVQFRERIIEAADHNTQTNDARSDALFLARTLLFAVLVSTAVAGFFFVSDQLRDAFNDRHRKPSAAATSASGAGEHWPPAARVSPEPNYSRG